MCAYDFLHNDPAGVFIKDKNNENQTIGQSHVLKKRNH